MLRAAHIRVACCVTMNAICAFIAGAGEDVIVYDFIARSWASSRFSKEVSLASRCMCHALKIGGNWLASVTENRWAVYWETQEVSFVDSVGVPLSTWRKPHEESFCSIVVILDPGNEAALPFVVEEMAVTRESAFAHGCTSISWLRRSLPNVIAVSTDPTN